MDDPVLLMEVTARARNPSEPVAEQAQPLDGDGATEQRE